VQKEVYPFRIKGGIPPFHTLTFARNGNTAPILLLESDTTNISLGDHLDSEVGLQDSGYTARSASGGNQR
jgi:hypothetical protein